MNLRPYQLESVDLLRNAIRQGAKRPILGMPTGSGKTVTFAYLIDRALAKGSRVGVVAHRTELIDQARATIKAYGLNPDRISFGMVQTYVRSPHKIPAMDLVIIDESHIGNFRRFIELLPSYTQVIGVTATPIGASKKQPLNKVFDHVIYPIQIRELIEQGYLSRPEYHIWKLDESRLQVDFAGEFTTESQAKVFDISNLLEAVNRRIGKTIIFCSSIEQSQKVFDAIPDLRKFIVHSKMSYQDRKSAVDLYKSLPAAIMVNCGILTAGFDDPTIETVIIYRATTSVALWLQMVGRGSRVTETKSRFYIFDLGNNHSRLLPWEANRNWPALFENQGKNAKSKEAARKSCVNCQSKIAASAKICEYCGFTQPIKANDPPKADTVQVISSYSELPPELKKPFDAMTVAELVARAAYGSPNLGRPFKVGWILGQIKTRPTYAADVQELARIKGYKSGWVQRQLTEQ
jgi:superfamily II DNA or RNA helicase